MKVNCTLSNVLIFVAGGAIGSLVTWQLLKKQYEKYALEEVQQIRDFYYNLYKDKTDSDGAEETPTEEKKDSLSEDYASVINENGYSSDEVKEVNRMKIKEPYVISPDEYGEIDEYETISLTYYADGVLTDDLDEPIYEIDEIVGEDSFNHFGEYEEDTVFVRNERLKCDYEICRDSAKYNAYGDDE